MEYTFNAYYTLIAGTFVLLLGRLLVYKIPFLRNYNIPEPVAGGLIAAILAYLVYLVFGVSGKFSSELQTGFMLVFFASIGLGANLSKLKEGGFGLFIFLLAISAYILIQNLVGMGLASVIGLDPLMGLITGSITLTGGHGTAGAWGHILETKYGLEGATTLGMASATFGLVIGGLIGGPVAKFLIERHGLATGRSVREEIRDDKIPVAPTGEHTTFEFPHKTRLITADNAISTLAMFAACLAFGNLMTDIAKGTSFELPTFVWALLGGVIVRNFLESVVRVPIFDRAIDVFGNASLSLFLAMALLSLKLWQLVDLAGPLVIILSLQTVVMALFAAFVTFKIMGSNYDAAVLAAGHCGFGMGATPTAIANMQAITNMYGPSHKAFLIVPLAGAFFIDLVNVVVIQTLLKFFG
ncbi:glutamate:Na+ symporter, ESS family [Acinetobacter marinus]|uniref:Sodium/glutamate symporter n=1 Tax=Acinetobacter marinus TaxID=281375 RepID=A0A1G6MJG4_9GAMM|nr:sodium/glutamate symporter [Acinetobacter marinus]SDC55673.1 glutamate:Na+ symporter, ESS family [Acinetobacter marinus]